MYAKISLQITSDVGKTNLSQKETREFTSTRLFFLVVFTRTVVSLPYHAFQNIIDDEVTLNNDKQQGHVGPAKLAKLELVLTLLQIGHKEHEPYI